MFGPLRRLLPRSLLRRVALLYIAALLPTLIAGLAAFALHEARSTLEEARRGTAAIGALISPVLAESAVIGDYDTIQRTLERCIEHPLIERAGFTDAQGGRVQALRAGRASPQPPAWLTRSLDDSLQAVEIPVRAGGADYGVAELVIWHEAVAARIWEVVRWAALCALLGMLLGVAFVWRLLKGWLGQLDQVQSIDVSLQAPGGQINQLMAAGAPLEFQRAFAVINRVAASLQTERAQAAVTLAAIDEGVATLNAAGELVLVNPVLCALLGRPAAELLGQPLQQVWPALCFEHGAGEAWRHRRISLDGPPARAIEASLTPIGPAQGEMAGWVLSVRDVSHQRALEDELRRELDARAAAVTALSQMLESGAELEPAPGRSAMQHLSRQVGLLVLRLQQQTAQLNAIFAMSPDGFVSFDRERRVQFVSPSVSSLLSLPAAALSHLSEADLGALIAKRLDPAAGTEPVRLGALTKQPRTVHLVGPEPKVIALAMHTGGGDVSRVLHLRDITQQFEVDRLKSEFLTTAAHELRTPMTSIYGFIELLMHRPLDPEKQRELYDRIHRQSRAMMAILDELLDLSRIESRRGQDLVLEQLALQPLLREAVHDYQPPQGREPPELQLCDEPLRAQVDAGKLRQALRNILSNAYKYSPGGGAVTLRLLQRRDQWARIEIEDRGLGMEASDLARITERFFRADKSGAIPGTGLGMALVKEIVELLGGRLNVRSEPSRGTVVAIDLPLSAVPQETLAP